MRLPSTGRRQRVPFDDMHLSSDAPTEHAVLWSDSTTTGRPKVTNTAPPTPSSCTDALAALKLPVSNIYRRDDAQQYRNQPFSLIEGENDDGWFNASESPTSVVYAMRLPPPPRDDELFETRCHTPRLLRRYDRERLPMVPVTPLLSSFPDIPQGPGATTAGSFSCPSSLAATPHATPRRLRPPRRTSASSIASSQGLGDVDSSIFVSNPSPARLSSSGLAAVQRDHSPSPRRPSTVLPAPWHPSLRARSVYSRLRHENPAGRLRSIHQPNHAPWPLM